MKNVLLLIGLLSAGNYGIAQQTTTAAGGNGSGPGGSISYSVGEIGYTATSGAMISLTAGVQQPYAVQSVGLTKPEHQYLLEVYPNPTSADLTLSIPDYQGQPILCQVMDALGHVVTSKTVEGPLTRLATGQLPASIYYVQVLQNERTVQSFRIIKY